MRQLEQQLLASLPSLLAAQARGQHEGSTLVAGHSLISTCVLPYLGT